MNLWDLVSKFTYNQGINPIDIARPNGPTKPINKPQPNGPISPTISIDERMAKEAAEFQAQQRAMDDEDRQNQLIREKNLIAAGLPIDYTGEVDPRADIQAMKPLKVKPAENTPPTLQEMATASNAIEPYKQAYEDRLKNVNQNNPAVNPSLTEPPANTFDSGPMPAATNPMPQTSSPTGALNPSQKSAYNRSMRVKQLQDRQGKVF